MSVQQHSATTALLASPSVQAAPGTDQFITVQRGGYHKGEVDKAWRWAMEELDKARREIERLAGQAAPFIARELESPQGQRLIAELIQVAADEIAGQQAAAAEEIAQMIAGAHQQAESIIAESRQQADQAISSATQQAGALVASARADAKKTTDDAAAHAAAVHEAAGERLAQFTRIHEDGLARLRQVSQVTSKVLEAEESRGSLKAEVDKALAAVRR